MFLAKNYKPILKYYFIFLSFISLYYLAVVNANSTYNAMSEWVINYQGGFVRRGLFGEIIFQISNFLNLNLRFSFLVFQSFLYLIFYYLIYDLLKKIKPNYFVLLAIFSPIFIFFPISELEAIGRKEILMFIILIVSINLYFKYNKNDLLILFLSIAFPIIVLTHESSIFYSFFFLSLVLITKRKINFSYLSKLFVFSLPTLISIYVIYFFPHTPEDTARMCEELENIGETCGLAAVFISKGIGTHMAEIGWQKNHVLRYIFIFFVGFFALIYLSTKSKFNDQLINPYFLQIPFICHFLILILPTLLMFIIAVDSGRWTHMSYSMSFIYYFGLLKNKAIILNNKIFTLQITNKKIRNFLYSLLFIIICLSWNPKAVYHEDLGSFPLYRAIEKFPNYYDNISKIQIFR